MNAHGGLSNVAVILGALHLVLNVWLTLRLFRASPELSHYRNVLLIVLWLLPILGVPVVWLSLRQDRKT